MTPTTTINLIENKGLMLVITSILIYFLFKYFNTIMSTSNTTNKEILNTLNEINNYLVNGYSKDNDFILLIKLRGRYLILEFKWEVVKYILHNNIKEHFDIIELELKNFIDNSNNRTLELLCTKATPKDLQDNVSKITNALKNCNTIVIPILNELKERHLNLDEKINIIRSVENHFNKIESEFLKNLNL